MQRTRRLLALGASLWSVAAWAGPTTTPSFDPADPPQGLFDEAWFAVMLQGQKAGYLYTAHKREDDLIKSRAFTWIAMRRGEVGIEMNADLVVRETLDGQPLGYEHTLKMAAKTIRTEATIRDGTLRYTRTTSGQTTRATADWPDGAKLVWGLYLLSRRQGCRPGTTIEAVSVDPMLDPAKGVALTTVYQDRETVDLFGRQVEAIRAATTIKLDGVSLTSRQWVDEQGDLLILEQPIGALSFRMVRCAKEFALAPARSPELFVSTMVPLDRPLDKETAKQITYRLSLEPQDGQVATLSIPATDMQSPTPLPDGSVRLAVRRRPESMPAPASQPAAPKQYLGSTVYLNWDDPAVRAMGDEGAGDATDPAAIAERLTHYVHKAVAAKGLNVGFATASEVARSREGDCSEHAVLLAALGRAKGIPSRVVSGLVYVREFRGKRHMLGYHMWTQFWIAGRWLDMDASHDQVRPDPTHIALSTHALADGDLARAGLALIQVIGRLNVEVLASE